MKKLILAAALLQAFSLPANAGQGAGLRFAIAGSSDFYKTQTSAGETITAAKELGTTDKWRQCIAETEEIFNELRPIAEKQSGADLSNVKIARGIKKVLSTELAEFDRETKTIIAASELCFQPRSLKEFVIGHELGHSIVHLEDERENEDIADAWGAKIASEHLGEKISIAEFEAMYAENHVKAAKMEARLHELKPTVEVGTVQIVSAK